MAWPHFLFLVVLLMPVYHCADAQAGTTSPPPLGLNLRENLKEFLSVMLVSSLSAFIFMGFYSLYLRHCSNGYSATFNPIAAAADLCCRSVNRRSIINNCPILIYSTVKDLKIGKGALECAVCLGEFQDCDKIRLLPKCHHVFHPDCIDVWLFSHMTCPVCRARLTYGSCDNAVVIPMLTSNTENNPTTRPESGLGHEMEPPQHQQVVLPMDEEQSSTLTGSGVAPEPETVLAQTPPPRELRRLDKFPRSHSTGHSLLEPEENLLDRYTLRLPEHVRNQILVNHSRIRRSTTSDYVVLPGAWSSKRACYRSDNNMERWSLSMTPPPFVSRGWGWDSVKNSASEIEVGDELYGRTCWTPLRMPFYMAEGAQNPSHIPPV